MNALIGDIGNTITKVCLIDVKSFKVTKIIQFSSRRITSTTFLKKELKKIVNHKSINKIALFSSVVPKYKLKLGKFLIKVYKIKLIEIKEKNITVVDVIKSLFTMEYPADDDFVVKVEKGIAQIKLPERTKFDVNWFQAKYRIVAAIRKHTDVTDIEFLEHYEGTKPEKKETKASKKKNTRKKTSSKKKK